MKMFKMKLKGMVVLLYIGVVAAIVTFTMLVNVMDSTDSSRSTRCQDLELNNQIKCKCRK